VLRFLNRIRIHEGSAGERIGVFAEFFWLFLDFCLYNVSENLRRTFILVEISFMKVGGNYLTVLRIRIRMFLGLPDPDPIVRGTDLDHPIIKQK
jgi:hypothetical protein